MAVVVGSVKLGLRHVRPHKHAGFGKEICINCSHDLRRFYREIILANFLVTANCWSFSAGFSARLLSSRACETLQTSLEVLIDK